MYGPSNTICMYVYVYVEYTASLRKEEERRRRVYPVSASLLFFKTKRRLSDFCLLSSPVRNLPWVFLGFDHKVTHLLLSVFCLLSPPIRNSTWAFLDCGHKLTYLFRCLLRRSFLRGRTPQCVVLPLYERQSSSFFFGQLSKQTMSHTRLFILHA